MESKWGLIPDMSGSITLRELIRIDVAKELTMTGRIISGEEAATLGLVTRCVSDPMMEAIKVAKEIKNRFVKMVEHYYTHIITITTSFSFFTQLLQC